jgi:hypothetical protein
MKSRLINISISFKIKTDLDSFKKRENNPIEGTVQIILGKLNN